MTTLAEEVKAEQRSKVWFDKRLGRATSSRFNDVMAYIKSGEAAARKNYRAELVTERLTGEELPHFTSQAMQWGTDTEPLARLRYTLASGNQVQECGFYAHKEIMAGASPDGLVNGDGVLEIKCPNTATHIESLKNQDVPRQYYWQVIGHLWMTGRKWCDFVSFDPRLPDNASLFIKRVPRDEEAVKKLESSVIEFLKTVDDEVEFIRKYQ